MAKYRDRLQIVADILRATGSGSKKTRIMGIANLSYSLFEDYLNKIVQVGFLRFADGSYEVTEKGQDYLSKYNEYYSKHSRLENELRNILAEREILSRMCQPLSKTKLRSICESKRRK